MMQTANSAPTSNIVVVPDLSAFDLTALARRATLCPVSGKEHRIPSVDHDYQKWNYYVDTDGQIIRGRGLMFETLIAPMKVIAPSANSISYDYARAYFRERGYLIEGNAGAYTEWRRTCGLPGYHVAVLEDNRCWSISKNILCVPCSNFDGNCRELKLRWIKYEWVDHWSFVGFRPVSAAS